MNWKEEETWYLILMIEGKEAVGKEVPNQQDLASDENTDFS
jgi:hypothetical protein